MGSGKNDWSKLIPEELGCALVLVVVVMVVAIPVAIVGAIVDAVRGLF